MFRKSLYIMNSINRIRNTGYRVCSALGMCFFSLRVHFSMFALRVLHLNYFSYSNGTRCLRNIYIEEILLFSFGMVKEKDCRPYFYYLIGFRSFA